MDTSSSKSEREHRRCGSPRAADGDHLGQLVLEDPLFVAVDQPDSCAHGFPIPAPQVADGPDGEAIRTLGPTVADQVFVRRVTPAPLSTPYQ